MILPLRIDPLPPNELMIAWNTGQNYAVPYVELRFACPCASCVDEHTGERVLKRENIPADIRITDVQMVGRYALKLRWSDEHSTGIYHFDRLYHLCTAHGRELGESSGA